MPNGPDAALDKRATVYFEPEVHRALRIKAAEVDTSVSHLVNQAVKLALAEDAADLDLANARAGEPGTYFAELVKDLKVRGKL